MNILIIQPTKKKFVILIGAFVCIVSLSAFSMQTPTHALSLDPAVTVTAVAAPISDTTTIAPLLMNVQIPLQLTPLVPLMTSMPLIPLPASPTPAIIVAPIDTTVPVMITPPTSTPTTPPSATVNATASPKKDTLTPSRARTIVPIVANAVVPTFYAPVVFASSFGEVQTLSGLSTIDKQAELLQAPAHVSSPALMYTTNQINPKLANLIFVLGMTGVLAGGCVIFATRPITRITV